MSSHNRNPGDLAIQIYVPADVGYEIGKLRLASRQTNNTILNELIAEALQARGLLATPTKPTHETQPAQSANPTPKKSKKPAAQVEWTNPVTSLSQLPKPKSLAQRQAEAAEKQLSLPVVAAEVPAAVVVDIWEAKTKALIARELEKTPWLATPEDLDSFVESLEFPPAPVAKPSITHDEIMEMLDAVAPVVAIEEEPSLLPPDITDPNAPLDLSILSRANEPENDDPFAELD